MLRSKRFVPLLAASLLCVTVSRAAVTPTGESPEIQFNHPAAGELKAKAANLATPVAIFQYVHNNYEFALYHGARGGSINTFLGGRGNDVDLAATLIAMLRSRGIPARYTVATVRVPSALITNLLKVENTDLAFHLLRDEGIQGVVESADKSTIDFEHVWVEALTPSGNYRGHCSSASTTCNWVSLDPSVKQYATRDSGFDPYSNVFSEYASHYNAARSAATGRDQSPLESYQEQVLAWLRSAAPGKTLDDIPDFGAIVPDTSGLLPASLPYLVIGSIRRYNSAAEHDAAVPVTEPKKWTKTASLQIHLQTKDGTLSAGGGSGLLLTDLATQRLTLSTEIVNGIPNMVVRLGNTEVARPIQDGKMSSGYTPAMGDPFQLTFSMDGSPAPDSSAVDQVIRATYDATVGGYYLLATGGETSNWSQVHRAAQQLIDASRQYPIVFNPGEAGCGPRGLNCTPYVDIAGTGAWAAGDPRLIDDKPALDALTGGLLFVAATQYYAKARDGFAHADAINKIKTPICGFMSLVGTAFGEPVIGQAALTVRPSGLVIDTQGIAIAGSWRIDQPAALADTQFAFFRHILASLEQETWQQLTAAGGGG